MLTGQRLFEGETTSHTLADVIRAEIDLARLPATTPPAIRGAARTLPRSRAAPAAARHPRSAARDRPPARTQRVPALGRARGGVAAAAAGPARRPRRGPDRRGRRRRRAGRWRPRRGCCGRGPRRSRSSGSKCGCPPTELNGDLGPAFDALPRRVAHRVCHRRPRRDASCTSGSSTSWTARSSRFATTTASPTTRSSRPTASGSALSPPRRCARCRRPAARP